MRAGIVVAVVLLGLAAAAALALGQGAAPPATQSATLSLGPDGGDATLRFPFTLADDGSVYAKLLPTPWNPVLPDGAANGTVSADRSQGLHGWWVRLAVEPAEGAPVDLGAYADSSATREVALAGQQEHTLRVTVHAPANAGKAGAQYRVDLALAHRDGAEAGAVDATWGLSAALTVAQAAPAPLEIPALLPVLLGAVALVVVAAVLAKRHAKREPRNWL